MLILWRSSRYIHTTQGKYIATPFICFFLYFIEKKLNIFSFVKGLCWCCIFNRTNEFGRRKNRRTAPRCRSNLCDLLHHGLSLGGVLLPRVSEQSREHHIEEIRIVVHSPSKKTKKEKKNKVSIYKINIFISLSRPVCGMCDHVHGTFQIPAAKGI